MRAIVGLLLVGLCLTACSKKEDPPANQDSKTQIGATDNGGPSLGDPTPQPTGTTQPLNGATPTKVILPVRTATAFGAIGTPAGTPVQPPSTPAATPTTPVATTPATPAPTTPAVTPTTGRGVPPPPGGRPKPGSK